MCSDCLSYYLILKLKKATSKPFIKVEKALSSLSFFFPTPTSNVSNGGQEFVASLAPGRVGLTAHTRIIDIPPHSLLLLHRSLKALVSEKSHVCLLPAGDQ